MNPDFLKQLLERENTQVPTTHCSGYWLYAAAPEVKKFSSTDETGKWLITLEKEVIDAEWEKVKKACSENKLLVAKCSTLLLNQRSKYQTFLICVYTKDWSDAEDVQKVREVLRNIGFTQPLKYKRDIETMNGVYDTDDEFYIVE